MLQLAAKFERLAQLLVEFAAEDAAAARPPTPLPSPPRARGWLGRAAPENSIAGAEAAPK
jgi:hypothetical protein